MKKCATIAADEGAIARPSSRPPRRSDTARKEIGEGCLEQLQAIETGWGPESESTLLRDLLTQSPKLADLNAYKHRLHALRCDYVNARLRVLDLEDQLAHSRLLIQQMRSTRVWRMRERYHCWRRTLSEGLRRLRRLGAGRVSDCPPVDEVCGSCPVP